MDQTKLGLVNEQTSPLFRIMSVYNNNAPVVRKFDNNICAFHVGGGYILSVAHNLKVEATVLHSIDESIFQERILNNLNAEQKQILTELYVLNNEGNKRHLSIDTHEKLIISSKLITEARFDKRYINLYNNNICKPFLIAQFRNDQFYNNQGLTNLFEPNHHFTESELGRHTFMLELELVEAFYNEDIALYKIINTDQAMIDRLPSIEIDYGFYDNNNNNYLCLQSAPTSELGRLLNKAEIEGVIDNRSPFLDRFEGNYNLEGLRYLIKGYFRFGSSGAPYIIHDTSNGSFKVNAVQSEACPIQLSINGNKDGNCQYVNAIASPLSVLEHKLTQYIGR
ncbi:MAG: hypothetical protein WC004_00565 [Candidatus Absconditabacterales bacterium]